ncbi:hypothetical protein BLOT_016003 [Blomia tropicalis]|nr:hypothetical protein BLOT_016003 [Blomia tropicalis]
MGHNEQAGVALESSEEMSQTVTIWIDGQPNPTNHSTSHNDGINTSIDRKDDEKPICRICHCSSEDLQTNTPGDEVMVTKKPKMVSSDVRFDLNDPLFLISPCFCTGTHQYVHHKCLQQWIRSSNHKYCELCKYNFKLKTKSKPIYKWESLNMTSSERRKLLFQLTFNLISIIFVFWSIYVIAERATHELVGQLGWRFWLKMTIVTIGFICGILFIFFQLKLYISTIVRWKQYNQIVIIENVQQRQHKMSTTTTTKHMNEHVIPSSIDLATCCESK